MSPSNDYADVRAAVTAATRMYASACESAGRELPPLDPGVSTTEGSNIGVRLTSLAGFDAIRYGSVVFCAEQHNEHND